MTKVAIDPDKMLVEFISTFQASLDFRLWLKLIEEETRELLDADRNEEGRAAVLKELVDVGYVVTGSALVAPDDDLMTDADWDEAHLIVDEANAVVEAILDKYQFDSDVVTEAFIRVHRSNMSKLGDDGKPIRREDGKIMKGPNYRAPDLSDLV